MAVPYGHRVTRVLQVADNALTFSKWKLLWMCLSPISCCCRMSCAVSQPVLGTHEALRAPTGMRLMCEQPNIGCSLP